MHFKDYLLYPAEHLSLLSPICIHSQLGLQVVQNPDVISSCPTLSTSDKYDSRITTFLLSGIRMEVVLPARACARRAHTTRIHE